MSGSRKYPPELRERAVRMVAEIRDEHESHWAAMKQVVDLLGVGSAETVRQWVRQAEVDTGARPGTTNDETAELKRLRRENAELKRTTSTLKAASAFFAAEIDRRAADPGSSSPNTRATETQVTCGGHESICATLTKLGVPVAPLTHYAHRTRVPPAVSSDGTLHSRSRSSVLQVNREGIPFARCTVERLMRRLRLAGVSRGKTKRTTVPDPSASWLADLVRRGFAPLTPNRL